MQVYLTLGMSISVNTLEKSKDFPLNRKLGWTNNKEED